MLNKKINIYCSNSSEIIFKEYPNAMGNFLDYDFENNRPRGIKEITESFMELLNADSNLLEIWTLSDIPLNIMGHLIAEGIFSNKNVKLIFVGVDEDNGEIKKAECGYTKEGFGDEYWPLGAMVSWYGFYKPGYYKLLKKAKKITL